MITPTNMKAGGENDTELVAECLAGNRDAFEGIVTRYQSLVCSLAYSATGNLGESEDLAQETFITAWTRLGHLREPGKLRGWLCGIARNRINNALRREGRQPLWLASPLEAEPESAAPEALPSEQAISREEAAILWRALERIPPTYREVLVLFYRERQSIECVAEQLELTEETARQRLSRGRRLLHQQVAAFVEGALERTAPGKAFTVGVLVALPMVSASAASAAFTAGVVAEGSAATAGKGILAKVGLGVFIGPMIGLACAYIGTTAAASTARSEPERACVLRYTRRGIIPFCFVMSIGLAAVLSQAGKLYTPSAIALVLGISAWTMALVGGILWLCHRMDRAVMRIRIETGTTDDAYARVLAARGKRLRLPKYFESRLRFLGLPLFAMAWGGTNADQYRSRAVYGWVAVGDVAISPFLAVGGVAVAPIAVGAISVGVLSLSIFWGIAVGVFAVGSLAFGWWALGFVAAGVQCAVGFAAVARDYAVGMVASAAEAGTPAAREWVTREWFADVVEVMVHQAHWWILVCVVLGLGLSAWRGWRLRRCPHEGQRES